MLKTIKNNKLLDKLLYVFAALFIFRMLSLIPVPFLDPEAISEFSKNALIQSADLFSGGALSKFTIMATGVSSYITASIVIQLLVFQVQLFHDISRSPAGDKTIKKITIALGVLFAFITSLIATKTLNEAYQILTNSGWYIYTLIAIIHSAATGFAIYLSEGIEERFGNGLSILIGFNILSSLPPIIHKYRGLYFGEKIQNNDIYLFGAFFIVLVLFIAFFEKSEIRLPMVYSKNLFTNKDDVSYFPIKLNLVGIMPIIITSSLFEFVLMITKKLPWEMSFLNNVYLKGALFVLFIIVFTRLYMIISFSPKEMAKNIQSSSAFIQGVASGTKTEKYLNNVKSAMVFISSVYLIVLIGVPILISSMLKINLLAPTSIIILVSVGVDFINKIKLDNKMKEFEDAK